MYKFFCIFNFLMFGNYALAEQLAENEELKNALNQNTYEPNFLSLFLGLFLVIALIYLTGFIYQKLTKVKINHISKSVNKTEIISTTPLGQGKNIHVIKINEQYLLIGSTQNSISVLKELDKDYIINKIGDDNENSENRQ